MKNTVLFGLFISLITMIGCKEDDPVIDRKMAIVSVQLADFQFIISEVSNGRIDDVNWPHVFGGLGTITFTNTNLEEDYSFDLDGADLSNATYEVPMGTYDINITFSPNQVETWLPYTANANDIFIDSDQSLILSGDTDFGLLLLDTTWVDQTVPPTFDIDGTSYPFELRDGSNYYYLYAQGGIQGILSVTDSVFAQRLSQDVNITTMTIHSYVLEIDSSSISGIDVLLDDFLVVEDTLTISPNINLENGLTAYYPFNGNANDESGNGNNGIASGATLTEDRNGIANSAYLFDGVDDWVEGTATSSLDFTGDNPISISAWIYVESLNTSNNSRIFTHSTAGSLGQQYSLSLNHLGSIYFLAGSGGFEGNGGIVSGQPLALEQWHHIGMIYDGYFVKLFHNGQVIFTNEITDSFEAESVGNVFIGARGDLTSKEMYHGKIDEIRVYNRSITNAEMFELAR